MFNEILAGNEVSEAKELFQAALDGNFDLGTSCIKILLTDSLRIKS